MFSVVVAPGTHSVVGDLLHRRAVTIARMQARSECNEDAFATDAFAASLPERTSALGVHLLRLVKEYNQRWLSARFANSGLIAARFASSSPV